jgi:hypothetical protein
VFVFVFVSLFCFERFYLSDSSFSFIFHFSFLTPSEVLSHAVRYCRQVDVLWLMYAKHSWVQGNVDGARRILNEALSSLPGNEQIWLAAVKLEKVRLL